VTGHLTLLCVHAHPDDESSSTGGILRAYADEGVRTVLVTCTDGSLGDAPDGTKPEVEHHEPDEVAAHRLVELRDAVSILGVSRLELLGFKDSGMDGWPQNDEPGSFWSTPVEEGAARLLPILLEERPQVIVTYDANGGYGHPDHIQAHRITVLALQQSGLQARLFYTARPRSSFARFQAMLEEAGMITPDPEDELLTDEERSAKRERQRAEAEERFGTPDELIGAVIDISGAIDSKFDALAAHGSQVSDSFFMKIGRERFREMFGREAFIRAIDPFGRTGVEDDLFVPWRG
jgi:LmbE family N-acetylglucosaminyl deacetylase